jgi:hypothetical protein
MLHPEFLPQPHLDTRGSFRLSGGIREGMQLNASSLPGILQRRAA